MLHLLASREKAQEDIADLHILPPNPPFILLFVVVVVVPGYRLLVSALHESTLW